ncbi:hypothetical protein DSM112329_03340 [Paraconexibacter sp. AEG42_29]|uniref:Uncharacterized protein n=1 Tax=Paraconexibacter sp. AEG42_29 TaxID=2997339 RepID=A0AAU7AXY1_9ACTN
MEPFTLAETDGRKDIEGGLVYTFNRVPDDVAALGIAKLISVERGEVVLSYEAGSKAIEVTGLSGSDVGIFEKELRDVLVEVNRAQAVADRIARDEGDWTPEDGPADAEDEAAVDRSFTALN